MVKITFNIVILNQNGIFSIALDIFTKFKKKSQKRMAIQNENGKKMRKSKKQLLKHFMFILHLYTPSNYSK